MRSAKLALLAVAKGVGGFRVARWLTAHRLKILCYHGFELVDEASFRPKLFITAERFERRLATIRRYGYRVIRLDDAIEALDRDALPAHSIVMTLDDGFHSVHRVAVPLLRRYGFPATLYATTYYVRNGHPIFRLAIQYMFWRAPRRVVDLRDLPWTADRRVDLDDAEQVDAAMRACIAFGETRCDEAGRLATASRLGEILGVPFEPIRAARMLSLMSPEELRALAADRIDVELHTHRHTFPADDRAAAEREIRDNRAALREWLPGEARHFCYPSGEWTSAQWKWLDDLGVRSATTCEPGLNAPDTPRHALRRFLDGSDIDQLEFESALCGFSDLLRALRSGFRARVPRPRPA